MRQVWWANILCTISDGKARLSDELCRTMPCDGGCHQCAHFLGVDLADIGKEHFKSRCGAFEQLRRAA